MKRPSWNQFRRQGQKRVALLIDFSRAYGRSILMGIAQFVREHHQWSVQSEEWRWTEAIPSWVKAWKGDGLIVWIETPEFAAVVRRLGLPTVDVRGAAPDCGVPLVNTDNANVSRLAAEHLVEKGFHQFAFCGFTGANYSSIREHWFKTHLANKGFPCAIYSAPAAKPTLEGIESEKRGLFLQEHLARWLRSLPKPIGIMTCNDIRGQQVINACRRANLLVPEEVAVVGVDNDEIFCELSDPSLTSVEVDTLRIGYQAAALLERMMTGGKPPNNLLLIPPLRVVARRSTDVLALDDPHVVAGLRFMREHAFQNVTIDRVARVAGVSRRVFERRFAAMIGRSPKAEVLRIRLERVKELLLATNWPLTHIAEESGFNHSEHLHAIFTNKTGQTPGEFRRRSKTEYRPGVSSSQARL